MKKCEKEFLSKFESPSNELLNKLDENIDYHQFKDVKPIIKHSSKLTYTLASISLLLVCVLIGGFLLNPTNGGDKCGPSTGGTCKPSGLTTSNNSQIVSVPDIYFYSYFEYQGLRYEVETHFDKTDKANKKELLGSVEVTGYIEGMFNVYRYNAGLVNLVLEVDDEYYFATYRPYKYQFDGILEEFKTVYNLKDEQMDGTTQSFIKEIKLADEVIDTKYHDDIFYGLIESTKFEKNKRGLNSESSYTTATPGVSGSAETGVAIASYQMSITTVDDLVYIFWFSHFIGEPLENFNLGGSYFTMSERLANTLSLILDL